MDSVAFEVIGAPGANEYLTSGADPCFGKEYAKTAKDCIACRAPAILEGKIVFVRDLCIMKMKNMVTPVQLVRLTSIQVAERLERGEDAITIYREILGDAPPDIAAAAARQLLIDRLLYLKTLGQLVPKVPRLKEMAKP